MKNGVKIQVVNNRTNKEIKDLFENQKVGKEMENPQSLAEKKSVDDYSSFLSRHSSKKSKKPVKD